MSAASDRELSEWIRCYTPRLLAVARAFAHGPDEAEDILQQVWITAMRKAHDRPPGTPLDAWLHRVTLNEGRNRLRRARRRQRLQQLWSVPFGGGGAREPEAPDALAAIEAAAGGPERARSRLWRAVAELPALQRDVVLLRVLDDMSVQDTAQLLGRAEGTVKASLHRALRTLRATLGTTAAAPDAAPVPVTEEP